jgi:hypothetical protein
MRYTNQHQSQNRQSFDSLQLSSSFSSLVEDIVHMPKPAPGVWFEFEVEDAFAKRILREAVEQAKAYAAAGKMEQYPSPLVSEVTGEVEYGCYYISRDPDATSCLEGLSAKGDRGIVGRYQVMGLQVNVYSCGDVRYTSNSKVWR